MHIRTLPPLLPPLPPREPPAPPAPSRTAVALARVEDMQALWRDGRRQRKRAAAESSTDEATAETAQPAPGTGVDITA